MNKSKWLYATLAVAATALLVYSGQALAHHAFGAEFDRDAPIRVEGQVVQLEWVNPHSWIHLEVDERETPDGVEQFDDDPEVWMIEGGTPNVLLRRGLRRDCLTPGTRLVVDGYQAKDLTQNRMNGRDVTFPDGTKFFLGSSGTGAPEDGAEREQLQRGNQRC